MTRAAPSATRIRDAARRAAAAVGRAIARRPPAGALIQAVFCGLAFVFLVAPILVIIPLSFNAEPYFTFTEGMLRLDPEAWSLRWYRQVLDDNT